MTGPMGRSSPTGGAPAGTARRAARTGRSTRRNTRTRASTDRSTRHGPGERCGPGRPRSARPTPAADGRSARHGRHRAGRRRDPKRPVKRRGRPAGPSASRSRTPPPVRPTRRARGGTRRRDRPPRASGTGPPDADPFAAEAGPWADDRRRASGRASHRPTSVALPRTSSARSPMSGSVASADGWRERSSAGCRSPSASAGSWASSPAAVDSRRPATGPPIRWCMILQVAVLALLLVVPVVASIATMADARAVRRRDRRRAHPVGDRVRGRWGLAPGRPRGRPAGRLVRRPGDRGDAPAPHAVVTDPSRILTRWPDATINATCHRRPRSTCSRCGSWAAPTSPVRSRPPRSPATLGSRPRPRARCSGGWSPTASSSTPRAATCA